MNPLLLPCEIGEVSDGYHTFDELYKHRNTLFLLLMAHHPDQSWISEKHHDGTSYEGYFIAGMQTHEGDVTYHMPGNMWHLAQKTGATVLDKGLLHDGHDSHEVWKRLHRTITNLSFTIDQ